MQSRKEPKLVNTLATAMSILECFSTREAELPLARICEKTGLYKSRVHRLCSTLLALGYLVRASGCNYRLGPKLMVLGKAYEKTNTLRSITVPIMHQLSQQTGLSSTLYVIDGFRSICLAREMGPSSLVYAINEGDCEDLYTTAAGRILLAHAEADFVEAVLGRARPVRFTPSTLVQVEQIRRELEVIKGQGYAQNQQEREFGISAIAAPIFDHQNKVIASLAVAGSAHRFSENTFAELAQPLFEATKQISFRLGQSNNV